MPRRGFSRKDPIRAVFAIIASLFVAVQMASPLFLVIAALLMVVVVVLVVKHTRAKKGIPKDETSSLPFPMETRKRKGYQAGASAIPPVPMMVLPAVAPVSRTKPHDFSEEVFRRMDWLVFERFCVDLLRERDFQARKTGAGADGGVDIELRGNQDSPTAKPRALVQCKARSQALVGVDKVRELYGVVCAQDVARGILLCNTAYTDDAKAFAKTAPRLLLGDLSWIQQQLDRIPKDRRTHLASKFLLDDFDVPSCVQCEIKLVRRDSKNGPFWGCPNYPRGCRTKLTWRAIDG